MKTALIIMAVMALVSGALYAKGKIEKTNNGFKIKEVHTYYESQVEWGEGYKDHTEATPITGIVVLAVGTDWTYSAMTDANGIFKVEVKAGVPFKIEISNGNSWVAYDTPIAAIPEGTTKSELAL